MILETFLLAVEELMDPRAQSLLGELGVKNL